MIVIAAPTVTKPTLVVMLQPLVEIAPAPLGEQGSGYEKDRAYSLAPLLPTY